MSEQSWENLLCFFHPNNTKVIDKKTDPKSEDCLFWLYTHFCIRGSDWLTINAPAGGTTGRSLQSQNITITNSIPFKFCIFLSFSLSPTPSLSLHLSLSLYLYIYILGWVKNFPIFLKWSIVWGTIQQLQKLLLMINHSGLIFLECYLPYLSLWFQPQPQKPHFSAYLTLSDHWGSCNPCKIS